ncbi:MAG: protein kinase [Myxococcales bacterium]|nr:protein kinase [Myxococcales bacterium]
MAAPAARAAHAVIERSTVGPVTHLRINGVIDETFSAKEMREGAVGHVLIDLGRVDRISSFGVRQWMEFSKALPNGVHGLYVVNAPPMFVDQLAMVEGFAGVAQVLSILGPYSCESCGEDRLRLIDLRESAQAIEKGEAPEAKCPVCGNPLVFADNPAEYFAYARSHPVNSLDPTVDRYLKSLRAPEMEQPGSHLKVVQGNVTFIRLAGVLRGDLNVRRLAGGLQGIVAYDLGHVSGVEPPSLPKLQQILGTAALDAKVYLWRAPLLVLDAIANLELPPGVHVGTLFLPCECKSCGEQSPQRLQAFQYLLELKAGRPLPRTCQVCGGEAIPPLHTQLLKLLDAKAAADAPFEEIETLEPRALSQYLGLSSGAKGAPGHTPSKLTLGSDDNKLQILRRIGQGGMAEVFLARQVGIKGFEKYVVLKKILPQFAAQTEFVDMLFAEARSAARLTHPNIVQTYTVGMLEGSAYITMEYVRGADLRRLMVALKRSGQTLPVEHALRIGAEVAAGLHYAHCYVDPTGAPFPVVHRDVSPHNVLVSFDGAIKLSDFGIAKAMGESDHTQPGMLKGKIGYVSPEVVRGQGIDGRADVFALGVTLFEMLTLRMPFRRDNDAATLRAITQEPAPDICAFNPHVSQELAQVVYRALEKDTNERPNAGEFREALEEAMARYGYRSSPSNVSEFFRGALPDLMPDVAQLPSAPSSPGSRSGKISGSGSGSIKVSVAGENDPDKTSLTPSKPSWRVPDDILTAGSPPKAKPPPPPPQPPNLPRRQSLPSNPAVRAPAASAGTAATRPANPRPAATQPRPQPAAPAAQAPPPVPQNAFIAQGAPAQPAAAPQPVYAPIAMPPPSARTVPGRISWKWAGGGLVAGALALLAAYLLFFKPDKGVEIANVQPDERLYVGGIRQEGNRVKKRKGEKLQIGLAREGVLRRYGSAEGPKVDVELIPEATVPPGERAPLSVTSDPRGCSVTIGGARVPSATPLATAVEAGREVFVEVLCPGLPRWTRWVMAAPGQSVQVSARMFDEAGESSSGGCAAAPGAGSALALLALFGRRRRPRNLTGR